MKIKGNPLKKISSSMNPLNSIILLKKQMGMSEAFYLINPATEVFLTGKKLSQLNRTLNT